MNRHDVTAVYYTANRISEAFAEEVRRRLMVATHPGLLPIISVSQQPIDFGQNICVGPIGASIYNVYRQILVGAKAAETTFVACCEDDTLYTPEHFRYRPALDTFAYDLSRWVITRRLSADGSRREAFYYWRERHQMAMCIAPRALLIETLEERFARYPTPVPHEVAKRTGWGEPGRYEKNLGLTPRRLEYFRADAPSVTFNHSLGLMGRRRVNDSDQVVTTLAPWGAADDVWRAVHGND